MDKLAYPPRVTPFTKPFWDALRERRLTTTICDDCGHMTFPPKPICPDCWSSKISWQTLSGKGILRSYTEICAAPLAFATEVPFTICLVDLDEGVRCMSRVKASFEALAPDIRVRAVYREAEPEFLFEFEPDE
jgi:uncharacterized protein